jgi:hypothetical protein
MREKPAGGRGKHSAGEYALTFGIAAIACALIPGIGDLIAAPAAALAVVFGIIGVSHYDAGRTRSVLPAAVGTALGALALFFLAVVLIATQGPA